MAIINKSNRVPSPIVKFIGLPDKFILDGIVYDNGFKQLDPDTVEVPSDNIHQLHAGKGSYIQVTGSTIGNWNTMGEYLDVSSDDSEYNYSTIIDPYDNRYAYVCYFQIKNQYTYINKFEISTGKLVWRSVIQYYLGKIIGFNKDNVIVSVSISSASTTSTDTYIYSVDKNTGKATSVNTSFNNPHYTNILERDSNSIIYWNQANRKLYSFDLNAYTKTELTTSSNVSSIPSGIQYNHTSDLSPKMKNGYHYGYYSYISDSTYQVKYHAWKVDNGNYDYIGINSMELIWDEGIDAKYKKTLVYSTNYPNNHYFNFKLDDYHFITVYIYKDYSGQYNDLNYNSYYLLCKIDENNPNKLYIKSAGDLGPYRTAPIKLGKKLIFGTASEIATFEVDTVGYTVNKTWSISTNQMSYMYYYNGYIWWYSNITKELHYEVLGNTEFINLSTDKDNFLLENESSVQETNLNINVKDNEGTRIAKSIKITLSSPVRFKDDKSTEKVIITKTDSDNVIPIEIYSSGRPKITASIIEVK